MTNTNNTSLICLIEADHAFVLRLGPDQIRYLVRVPIGSSAQMGILSGVLTRLAHPDIYARLIVFSLGQSPFAREFMVHTEIPVLHLPPYPELAHVAATETHSTEESEWAWPQPIRLDPDAL